MSKSRQTLIKKGASASRSKSIQKVLDNDRRFIDDLIAAVVHDWARLTRRYRGLKAALQLHAPLAMIQLI